MPRRRAADQWGATLAVCFPSLTRERLKVGYWRFRGRSTRPRFIRHPMPQGPHCHRIAYVPVPLGKYLKRKLPSNPAAQFPIP